MRKRICIIAIAVTVCLLSGCSMLTIDQMYRVPERSESYNNLQSVMNAAAAGYEYSAPLSGENQQIVQMADLDGDGLQEYLLFAKSSSEKPLHILIFRQKGEEYIHADTIESTGTGFDLVEYVQMDDQPGLELVVGRQLSDQVVRSVSVYIFVNGRAQQVMNTNYTKFLTCDLDSDRKSELMVLHPGQTDTDNGVAELYGMENGTMERSNEAVMSGPTDKLRRIIMGRLHGGTPAVFVGSSVEESAIITDIYAMVDGQFTNVSLSSESGTSVRTLRNYYVYADDIDGDTEVELPSLITMKPLENGRSTENQYLIRWFAMAPDGTTVDKMYTYHDFIGGWYLRLDDAWASRITVFQKGSEYHFYLWNEGYTTPEKVFTIHVLTGQNREEQAVTDNRFVVYREESTVYAAHLEVASGNINITKDALINGFFLIHQDWKTGEM